MQRRFSTLALALALVALVAWFARESLHRRVELLGHAEWVTTDPDTLYHVRRVDRALTEGGAVAGFDERLNAPEGSAIPWPPYYTQLVSAVLAPFAPQDERERRDWIEPAVASFACVFSVLTSLAVALAAYMLVGPPLRLLAALIAGFSHALSPVAVAYGKLGNGDHHAFVSLLALVLLICLTRALRSRGLDDPRRALRWGVAAGAVAGLALGAWVASTLYIVQAQVVLALAVVEHSRRPRAGLAALGLAFHLTALLVLVPALANSPWRESTPWSVVNLSWFHAAFLFAGALVFAPLPVLRAPSTLLRAWPAIVFVGLLLAAGAAAFLDTAWSRAVREGFAWASRTDAFMARIGESRRLVGEGAGDAVFADLGYGVALLPLALGWMLWRAWRERCPVLTLWGVATLVLAVQSASQARFAEALSAPMAVVIAWAAARALQHSKVATARPTAALATAALLIALACVAQWPTLDKLAQRLRGERASAPSERPATLGARLACDWIAQQPALAPGESVLASWSHGHAIEWAAQRASVATNFGSYVGVRGFSAPARFFLSEDESSAVELLDEHRARFVLVDSDLPGTLNTLIEHGAPERRARYVGSGAERGGMVRPEWFLTLGARALFDGYLGPRGVDGAPFERLRLVWVAPIRDAGRPLRSPRDFAPAAMLWERVAGALVEARGAKGDELSLELELVFPVADKSLRWRAASIADAQGVARVRVPYATDGAFGEGRARGGVNYRFGSRSGQLDIADAQVRAGDVIALPQR